MILLISLTIFLLLRQNSHLLAFREIQKEQHRLLSDDVGKVNIVYLKFETLTLSRQQLVHIPPLDTTFG